MRLKAFAATAMVLVASATAQARPSPFGIPMGTPIARLKTIGGYGDKYIVVRPPMPNPNFERYTVIATPVHGVCAIKAETAAVDEQVKAISLLQSIVKLLSIYGRPEEGAVPDDVDLLHVRPKDLPDYREKWWDRSLPNNLSSISASISRQGETFYVKVWYFYRNKNGCRNWEPGQNRIGL